MGKKSLISTGPTKIKSIVNPDRQEKRRRARELCECVQRQVKLTRQTGLPEISVESHSFREHWHSLSSTDERLLWSLLEALLDDSLGTWLKQLVAPGLNHRLEEVKNRYGEQDPFVTVFTLLAYGERERASDEARQWGDKALAMYIVHSDLKDLSVTLTRQLVAYEEQGKWQGEYHRKCWYLIAGEVERGETTWGVTWQCALAMYTWYSTGLTGYDQALAAPPVSIQQLQTGQNTPQPDRECLWYQLLRLWTGDSLQPVDDWPLDFVWLLSLYRPQLGDKYTLRWCDRLESLDMPEWALFSALFLQERREEKVKHLLRHGEWDQGLPASLFEIPAAWICIARSLRAHDDWDFEGEYESLLEGELTQEAWMALINFLLPKHFYCTLAALRTSLSYIMEFTEPERPDVQLLKQAYMYLISAEEDASGLLRELETYHELLERYPNAQGLVKSLIEAIQEKKTKKNNNK